MLNLDIALIVKGESACLSQPPTPGKSPCR
jgi:hypothetical protein